MSLLSISNSPSLLLFMLLLSSSYSSCSSCSSLLSQSSSLALFKICDAKLLLKDPQDNRREFLDVSCQQEEPNKIFKPWGVPNTSASSLMCPGLTVSSVQSSDIV
ncbi:hypothetical protein BC829DRAFT_418554 [Chytridium lagenaria]|nr:hypothetical protein BC829DRAFT_418554 [Chytridium lagenaria]